MHSNSWGMIELLGLQTPPLLQWFTMQGPEPKKTNNNIIIVNLC